MQRSLFRNPRLSADPAIRAHFAELDERARRQARWCRVAAGRFARTRIVVVDSGRWRYALHRSSRKGVAFQLSRWCDGAPVGHVDFGDWDRAIVELYRERGRASRANA